MKKRRKTKLDTLNHSERTPGVEVVHFRLCHVCLHLNESAQEIFVCEKCQRHLTIELLVEEKIRAKARVEISEDEMDEEFRELTGLNGLAVLW